MSDAPEAPDEPPDDGAPPGADRSGPHAALADGVYDVLVVDGTVDPDDAAHLEVTILGGEHKGDVVAIRANGLGRDELDLLGLPGTLHVHDGVPHFTIDP